MTYFLTVSKLGEIKQIKAAEINDNIIKTKYSPKSALGKRNFSKKTEWGCTIDNSEYNIELWATTSGRAGSENKYDFPPPVDNELFYGSCILINKDKQKSEIKDLTKEKWEKIYEKLFGGFENLDSEEESSEDELKNVPKSMKTKSGYLKDGFVVENDSSNDLSNNSDEEDEESAISSEFNSEDDSDLDSELGSENYDYSDDE